MDCKKIRNYLVMVEDSLNDLDGKIKKTNNSFDKNYNLIEKKLTKIKKKVVRKK